MTDLPLYQEVLGQAWVLLPDPVRQMHTFETALTAKGLANVERGTGLASRLVGWLFGFPSAGEGMPVEVRFTREGGKEVWRRQFGSQSFSSVQSLGAGRFKTLLAERFGPFVVGLALVVDQGRLRLIVRRWSAFGIPMLTALAPRGEAYEAADDGQFCFHVEIGLPVIGLIVRYRGYLTITQRD